MDKTKTHEEQADEFEALFKNNVLLQTATEQNQISDTEIHLKGVRAKLIKTENALILVEGLIKIIEKVMNKGYRNFWSITDFKLSGELENLTSVKAVLEQRINK